MAASPAILEQLARLCREGGRRIDGRREPTGFAGLDALLPGGGWPVGAIAELMPQSAGIGELRLLLPALAALARAGHYIAWVEPPWLPYAPALAQAGLPPERMFVIRTAAAQESLWAAEQALRCPVFGAVLGWPTAITDRNVRRLQLAAEAGGSLGILYRPAQAAGEPSPAALRLRLSAVAGGLAVEIHKARGGRAGARIELPLQPPPAVGPGEVDDALAVHPLAAARA